MESDLPADLTALSAARLARAIAERHCSAREAASAFLARIDAIDRRLNAILEINPDALTIAHSLDESLARGGTTGPLHGVPVVLKANIDTADATATSAGSIAMADHRAAQDAPLVAHLREAGAVVLGKANLSEWANFRSASSTSGWSSLGGQTRNPYALDRSPSGSSSGSAVAVAARLAPLAVGTETDGSIVCPAGFNGVVGIKPTVGAIDSRGIVPIAASTDVAGPFARSVNDAALLLDTMAHPGDRVAGETRDESLDGIGLGVLRDYQGAGAHPGVDAVLADVVYTLSQSRVRVVDPVRLGIPEEFADAELQLLLHEFKDGLNRYLASHRAGIADLAALIRYNEVHADTAMPLFGQDLFEAAEATRGLNSPKYRDAVRDSVTRMRSTVQEAFERHGLDVLFAPANGPAGRIGEAETSGIASSSVAAVSGYPSVVVPGAVVDGMPVGVAFIGRPHSERLLMAVASRYEEARGPFPPPGCSE